MIITKIVSNMVRVRGALPSVLLLGMAALMTFEHITSIATNASISVGRSQSMMLIWVLIELSAIRFREWRSLPA